MSKIYLAGSCSSEKRTMMQRIATRLRDCGYEVYCPFELKIPNAWDMSQEEWAKKVFDADIAAIDGCDIFLLITPGRESTAGSNWEHGYAYAKGKYIVVIQYTDAATSLMTYCSSNQFTNVNTKYIAEDTILTLHGGYDFEDKCKTVLT